MEGTEKVGDVLRPTFGALKRVCEENSTSSIIGSVLRKYEKILDTKVNDRNIQKSIKPLFDKETVDKYASLGEEILEELKDEEFEIQS